VGECEADESEHRERRDDLKKGGAGISNNTKNLAPNPSLEGRGTGRGESVSLLMERGEDGIGLPLVGIIYTVATKVQG